MKNVTGKLTTTFLLLCSLAIKAMEQSSIKTPAELAQRLVDAKANRDKTTLPSELFGTVSEVLAKVKPAEIAACLKELRSVENELFDAVATYFVEQAIQCKQDKSIFDKWFKEKDDEEVLKILKQKFDHQKKYQLAEIFKQNSDLLIPGEVLRSIISPDCLSDRIKKFLYTMDGNDANYTVSLCGYEDHVNSVFPPDSKSSASFSSDNKYVVTGSRDFKDCTAKIWNVAGVSNPCCIAILIGHEGSVNSVSISSDNKYVVTGSRDKTAKIWDITDINNPNCVATLTGHTNKVLSVSISLDNKYVVTGSSDYTAKIWDATDINKVRCIATLTGHRGSVGSVLTSSDNKYIVTGSSDYTAKIWDVTDINKAYCIATLTGHKSKINSVSLSSDNKYVVTSSDDETVRIWDITDINKVHCIATLTGHESKVLSASFSSDNKYVVTGSTDDTAKIWDITDINQPHYVTMLNGHGDGVKSVSFSTDNKYILTGLDNNSAKVWKWKQWCADITNGINNLDLGQLMLLNYIDQLITRRVRASESTKKIADTLPSLIRKNIEQMLPSQAFAPASDIL